MQILIVILLFLFVILSVYYVVTKSLFTKIVIISYINSLVTLTLAVLGFLEKSESLIDIAIIYSLFSFVVTQVLIKILR